MPGGSGPPPQTLPVKGSDCSFTLQQVMPVAARRPQHVKAAGSYKTGDSIIDDRGHLVTVKAIKKMPDGSIFITYSNGFTERFNAGELLRYE